MLQPPCAHGLHQGVERLALLGEAVFHLRRDLGVLGAHDEAVGFQVLQLAAERLVGDAPDLALELVEPHGLAFHEPVHDDEVPLPADHRQRVAERRVGERREASLVGLHAHSASLQDST